MPTQAGWQKQAQSGRGKGRNAPVQTQRKPQKQINSQDTVSECTGHQKRLSAACWGTSQAQRAGSSLVVIRPVFGSELCQEDQGEPSPPCPGQGRTAAPQGSLLSLQPGRQGGFCHVLSQHSPSPPMSHGVDIIPRLTGDHTVTRGHP